MLRVFVGKEQVNQIFGQDLFENIALVPLFEELLGISGFKPFECVGTNEEMILALWMIYQQEESSDAPMLQLFKEKILTQMDTSDFFELEEKLLE